MHGLLLGLGRWWCLNRLMLRVLLLCLRICGVLCRRPGRWLHLLGLLCNGVDDDDVRLLEVVDESVEVGEVQAATSEVPALLVVGVKSKNTLRGMIVVPFQATVYNRRVIRRDSGAVSE
jgi:hypothetical protein